MDKVIHKGQLLIGSEARRTKRQHKTPCSDCPWARKALPGWLGANTAEQWVQYAHSECVIECHTTDKQCAGAAIYRANVLKVPRVEGTILELPANKITVFANPMEFMNHHALPLLGEKK